MVRSAGLLLFRGSGPNLEVLLAHPGGPFWAKKNDGAWSIPKGGVLPGEEPLAAAFREFREETGGEPPPGPVIALGQAMQRSRKVVIAFAAAGDFDPARLRSETFELEWPPRSGTIRSFPEVDRAEWFTITAARGKLLVGQAVFLDRLADAIRTGVPLTPEH